MEVKIIASEKNWIESSAVEQLRQTAALPGMIAAVGMPDLHPGKGTPIGAVFATRDLIYPHLVGNDIGCGMSLWQTELPVDKFKIEKAVRRLNGIEGRWEGDSLQFLQERNVPPTQFDSSLGTIGGGNHFAELQRVKEIVEPLLTYKTSRVKNKN